MARLAVFLAEAAAAEGPDDSGHERAEEEGKASAAASPRAAGGNVAAVEKAAGIGHLVDAADDGANEGERAAEASPSSPESHGREADSAGSSPARGSSRGSTGAAALDADGGSPSISSRGVLATPAEAASSPSHLRGPWAEVHASGIAENDVVKAEGDSRRSRLREEASRDGDGRDGESSDESGSMDSTAGSGPRARQLALSAAATSVVEEAGNGEDVVDDDPRCRERDDGSENKEDGPLLQGRQGQEHRTRLNLRHKFMREILSIQRGREEYERRWQAARAVPTAIHNDGDSHDSLALTSLEPQAVEDTAGSLPSAEGELSAGPANGSGTRREGESRETRLAVADAAVLGAAKGVGPSRPRRGFAAVYRPPSARQDGGLGEQAAPSRLGLPASLSAHPEEREGATATGASSPLRKQLARSRRAARPAAAKLPQAAIVLNAPEAAAQAAGDEVGVKACQVIRLPEVALFERQIEGQADRLRCLKLGTPGPAGHFDSQAEEQEAVLVSEAPEEAAAGGEAMLASGGGTPACKAGSEEDTATVKQDNVPKPVVVDKTAISLSPPVENKLVAPADARPAASQRMLRQDRPLPNGPTSHVPPAGPGAFDNVSTLLPASTARLQGGGSGPHLRTASCEARPRSDRGGHVGPGLIAGRQKDEGERVCLDQARRHRWSDMVEEDEVAALPQRTTNGSKSRARSKVVGELVAMEQPKAGDAFLQAYRGEAARGRKTKLQLYVPRRAFYSTCWRSMGRQWWAAPPNRYHSRSADLRLVGRVAPLQALVAAAGAVRDRRPDAALVTFSPKVFIPLTRLCRDTCGYCTFATGPRPGQRAYMTIAEVLAVAKAGAAAGCTEALFTLGDKPELRYPQARQEASLKSRKPLLAALGHTTTLGYVSEAATAVLQETGLLPHVNAGVMSRAEVARLRKVSASQGLMLESSAPSLTAPGGPHHQCPDKAPLARMATIAAAGEERVPFTSGLLIGIGESREDRVTDLLALRDLHLRHGHIQELIIQNFRAKKGTLMEAASEPSLEELQWTVAMARLTFGPRMSIQAPPNLTPPASGSISQNCEWGALLAAGMNDFGGISPLTKDWVNPEAPWPHLNTLADYVAGVGKILTPRLPIYPSFVEKQKEWLDPEVARRVHFHADSWGYARGENWSPGLAMRTPSLQKHLMHRSTSNFLQTLHVDEDMDVPEALPSSTFTVQLQADGTLSGCQVHGGTQASPAIADVLRRAEEGQELNEEDIISLFRARGGDFRAVCQAANDLRARVSGDEVTYVVNRNINYTNICTYRCQFCAFRLPMAEISRRAAEAWERGATEVCMQGGIHPSFSGRTYLEILQTVKEAVPDIHVHAFSPLEVHHGAETLNVSKIKDVSHSVAEFLRQLKDAGLGSLPGTAAEVLHDDVRQELCPDKLNTQEWLQVMETAHHVGLKTTSTIMFGHLENPRHWAAHLVQLRRLQERTGGFTEFVPLPFAPVFIKGKARRGPTFRESVLMHAVARIVLHPYITNIQASWVKMGPGGAAALLATGCNDMGGSLMNESITRAAGASHGEELCPVAMEELIRGVGRIPVQRTTTYGRPPEVQVLKSYDAPQLESLQASNHR
eukprot:SM000051S17538  [mRNA]  locus=s51:118416:129364:- [translate_table: standard]